MVIFSLFKKKKDVAQKVYVDLKCQWKSESHFEGL